MPRLRSAGRVQKHTPTIKHAKAMTSEKNIEADLSCEDTKSLQTESNVDLCRQQESNTLFYIDKGQQNDGNDSSSSLLMDWNKHDKDGMFTMDRGQLKAYHATKDVGKTEGESSDSDSDFEFPVENNQKQQTKTDYELSTSLQHNVNTSGLYVDADAYKAGKSTDRLKKKIQMSSDSELMKKSVITADFEKRHSIPPYQETINQLRKQRQKEKDSSKGKGWYNLPAPEMTEQKKNDLMVLQMRKVLDPKHFYKNPDLKALPKYFQMGTVVESAADFYNSRIPKKQRKATLVDELLADAEFRRYNKRKYAELQESQSRMRGAQRHMKRLKKKKKGK